MTVKELDARLSALENTVAELARIIDKLAEPATAENSEHTKRSALKFR
jgi:uncharacterized coiled-coil protein SlyX